MERIALSNSTFEGHNNAYLLGERVLVDTGDRLPGTQEQLEAVLERHDTSFDEIERIFLTHWHGDHRGLAGPIQRASDAEVYVHEADAPLVAGDAEAWDALVDRQERYFDHWGIPPGKQDEVRATLADVAWRDDAPDVRTIVDDETFTVGDDRLRVVHAPGHTAGLCMFELGGEVLSGDALLPKYTPNVGGADIRVERPLERYLETLRAITEAEYGRAWPGHREVIEEPADRAEFIIGHHEERAYRVLEALSRRGPCNTWTVSAELFGALEAIHILHGPGESYAHLEHLEREGSVIREGDEYRLADGVAARIDELEEKRWPLES